MGKKDLELLIMEFRLTLSFHAESRPCPNESALHILEALAAIFVSAVGQGAHVLLMPASQTE